MFRTIACTSVAALGMLMLGAAPAQAQTFAPHHYHVEYRLCNWTERVFRSHALAHEFADAKLSQGFEAKVVHHGRHFHVEYRLPAWRTYRTVNSHSYAHELQDMLRARGYETRVVHH